MRRRRQKGSKDHSAAHRLAATRPLQRKSESYIFSSNNFRNTPMFLVMAGAPTSSARLPSPRSQQCSAPITTLITTPITSNIRRDSMQRQVYAQQKHEVWSRLPSVMPPLPACPIGTAAIFAGTHKCTTSVPGTISAVPECVSDVVSCKGGRAEEGSMFLWSRRGVEDEIYWHNHYTTFPPVASYLAKRSGKAEHVRQLSDGVLRPPPHKLAPFAAAALITLSSKGTEAAAVREQPRSFSQSG
ncbi:hypothetical protein O3P69_020659 [Scylla paramamosain]|uniref:Uncharacterized protein n=1 Tax=Scylla paramamosain TaxID=85552 RepID=A0AAW0TN33_SCYPA